MCALPKPERNRHGIDLESCPPSRLVTLLVKLAMMKATNRNREFIAELASKRARLRKAKMVHIGGFATTHNACLLRQTEVVLVAQANGFPHRRDIADACCLCGG